LIINVAGYLNSYVFSSRLAAGPLRKVVFSKIGQRLKIESFETRRCDTLVISYDQLPRTVQEYLPLFKQIDLFFAEAMCHVRLSSEKWLCSWTKSSPQPPSLTHNRVKPYLFPEGEQHPFLCALGIMDEKGRVKASMRHKFVQINGFLEAISDVIDHLRQNNRPFRVVDAGCGKGYLTFALATLLTSVYSLDVEVIGIDSREDVISQCRNVCAQLGICQLDFRVASIGSLEETQSPDFMIALHACNTATDVALFKAIQWKSEAIAVAPCCQHELAPQIPPSLLPMIFEYPLFAQKAAALLTDAFRCELLSSCGYKVTPMEFVDEEHTPKNTLLKAIRHGKSRDLAPDFQEVRERLPKGILLERLLTENGFLAP
jgi:SAM-dependent methyltransferase